MENLQNICFNIHYYIVEIDRLRPMNYSVY